MRVLVALVVLCVGAWNVNLAAQKHSVRPLASAAGFRPKEGFVPDKESAIAIARAVLYPIYGRKQIDGEEPLHAHLDSGVWRVEGTLPPGHLGGVAAVELSKEDGRILSVIHYK